MRQASSKHQRYHICCGYVVWEMDGLIKQGKVYRSKMSHWERSYLKILGEICNLISILTALRK